MNPFLPLSDIEVCNTFFFKLQIMASIFKAVHPVELEDIAIIDRIKGDISFGPNSFKTYVSPKVRDLAESRTGVRSCRAIAL